MQHPGAMLLLILKCLAIVGIIGWVIYRWIKSTDDENLKIKLIVTALLLPVVALCIFSGLAGAFLAPLFGVIFAFMWAPNFGGMLARQFTGDLDGSGTEMELRPLYSIAEARRKQGKYAEALAEVRKQLARFPTDFPGFLMLAEIHAENLHDLAAAQDTIERLLGQAGHAPKNLALALNRLADWHLKLGQDPDSARDALERIRQLFPATELAHLAAQRIAHLAGREMLLEKQSPRSIALPHHEENIGLRQDFTGLKPPVEDPAETAAKYVKHLEQHPLDNEAREQLALLYAEEFQRLDLAAEQLEQLIAFPNQPAKQVVRWLNLLADLQIKYADSLAAARRALQRIVDLYPDAASAKIARNRLAYLKLELRSKQTSQVVKLGSYEANIGLKKDWPT